LRRKKLKPTAVLSGIGLIAASLAITMLGASSAGATPQSITLGCHVTENAGSPPPVVPIDVTIDGSSPSAAFPSGQNVSLTNVDITITFPSVVIGSLRQTFGSTGAGLAFSLDQGLVGVSATHATPSSRLNTDPTDISGSSVPVTGYVPDPDGAGPLTASADPISWTVQDVPYGAFVSSGLSGDTMAFSPSSAGSGFILGVTGHQNFTFLSATGFGTLNAGTPAAGPGTGTCTDFSPATGAFATTALGDVPPTVNAATFPAIGGIGNTLIVTGSSSDATGIDPATWAATPPVCGAGSATVSVGATTTSSAQLTFNAPTSTTTCTFDVTVDDTAGNTSAPATMTVNVVAGGDGVSQGVSQIVEPGVLDLSACGTTNPDPTTCAIAMSNVQLDGDPHTSTGAVNPLTVSDARGMPVEWTLTANMPLPLQNGNPTLSGPNARIASSNLSLSGAACAPDAGNLNSAPSAGAGGSLDQIVTICTAASGSNGGSFTADADLSLLVPSSVYAGTYTGTINFIVQ
jgi:hypothetical protein